MKRKTVFFDIDGALLGTRDGRRFQIPGSTLSALWKLRENGHRIAICSGRQEAFIHKFFPGLFDSFVAMNGTHVVFEGKTVVDRPLSAGRVKMLMAHFDSFGCRYVFVGNRHGWTRSVPRRLFGFLEDAYGLPDFLVPEWSPEQVEANMLDFIFETEKDYETCAGAFTEEMVLNRHAGGETADLSFREWDKAKGIGAFLSYGGIAKEDSVAFGDGYNDITMMDAVGCAVAMGNAVDELKRRAGYVTADWFDDGIERGLRHLGLI